MGGFGVDVAEVWVEPIAAGPIRRLAGHYLHGVAVLELVCERRQLAVDFRADAAVSQFGVDAVGEIQGRGAGGELPEIARGGIDGDLVLEYVGLERFHELFRAAHVAQPV